MTTNKLLQTDSYKHSHFLQYPPQATRINSYIEARGVSKDFPHANEVVHLGMQAFIQDYLMTPIKYADIEEARELLQLHGEPFNEDWNLILHEHGGYLPLHIQSIPEGMPVPLGTPVVQVCNTDHRMPWLTSFVETALLRAIWYPSTVATLSREIKKQFKKYLDISSDNPGVIEFMLHDFGARGVSSGESAALGGMGHLVNFSGSDTLEAVAFLRKYYSFNSSSFMPAMSIPAAEHSTITSWKDFGGEEAAFENMLTQFGGPNKLYAVVSDSYDIYNAVDNLWGQKIKQDVLNRGGRLVVRPDSGDPSGVVLYCVESLGRSFGYTLNSKGYKVLHDSVRVIQGDGVNFWSISEILSILVNNGWSVENVVFGMGGALLQKVNRDSLKWAMKASQMTAGGKHYDVYKDPVTDPGKVSKKGRFVVLSDFKVIRESDATTYQIVEENQLKTVYRIGLANQRFAASAQEAWATIKNRAVI